MLRHPNSLHSKGSSSNFALFGREETNFKEIEKCKPISEKNWREFLNKAQKESEFGKMWSEWYPKWSAQ